MAAPELIEGLAEDSSACPLPKLVFFATHGCCSREHCPPRTHRHKIRTTTYQHLPRRPSLRAYKLRHLSWNNPRKSHWELTSAGWMALRFPPGGRWSTEGPWQVEASQLLNSIPCGREAVLAVSSQAFERFCGSHNYKT